MLRYEYRHFIELPTPLPLHSQKSTNLQASFYRTSAEKSRRTEKSSKSKRTHDIYHTDRTLQMLYSGLGIVFQKWQNLWESLPKKYAKKKNGNFPFPRTTVGLISSQWNQSAHRLDWPTRRYLIRLRTEV